MYKLDLLKLKNFYVVRSKAYEKALNDLVFPSECRRQIALFEARIELIDLYIKKQK